MNEKFSAVDHVTGFTFQKLSASLTELCIPASQQHTQNKHSK